eukprot:2270832-Rhodomonas_salina.1
MLTCLRTHCGEPCRHRTSGPAAWCEPRRGGADVSFSLSFSVSLFASTVCAGKSAADVRVAGRAGGAAAVADQDVGQGARDQRRLGAHPQQLRLHPPPHPVPPDPPAP